jgi:hypothetical protein
MSFLQKLREWWKSTEPIDQEDMAKDFDAYMVEKRNEDRQALKLMKTHLDELIRIAFAHIDSEELDALVKRVQRALISDGELSSGAEALRTGLAGNFFRGKRTPYAFTCDARYYEDEDVACLNQILKVNGVQEVFNYSSPDKSKVPALLLENFSSFLDVRGYKCVGIETGGDEYVVFVTRSETYAQLIEFGKSLDIQLTDKPHLM